MLASPFASQPASVESLVARVRDDLERECGAGRATCPSLDDLQRAADLAVRELWGRPVTQFLHLLALRQARESLA